MISLRDVVTGFGNRDPLAEVWRRSLRGGGGGSAEITGTLPLRYIGNGKPLTDYMIYGNTVQNGAPSPEAPVDVVGCGERTKNICKLGTTTTFRGVTFTVANDGTVAVSGRITSADESISARVSASIYGDGYYTFSGCPKGGSNDTHYVYMWDYTTGARCKRWDGTTPVYNETGLGQQVKIISGHEVGYSIRVKAGVTYENLVFKPMIRLRNTTADFEPYGYKIDITSAGQIVPVYLGQVETTRRIKKLVLTGGESWSRHTDTGTFVLAISGSDAAFLISGEVTCICTHYPAQNNTASYSQMADKKICMRANSSNAWIRDTDYSTSADFKSYLAAQYAAGTPVTVWYVLAEPVTGIVNEPLHKIGDYADTISFAQAGATIPTVSGANVLDMTSNVKPSEVYIKGKGIKPTGYGQLVDNNSVRILDKNDVRILVHGQ